MGKVILIATQKPFAEEALDKMRDIVSETEGFEIRLLEKYAGPKELQDSLAGVHALIIRSDLISAETIERAADLKIILRAGAGVDNVDLDAATKKGVVVMNTPGQNANAVAELAIGLMLGLIRNKYNGTPGTELKDKKIALHGFGNIGKRLAFIAKGFDMEVYAFDPFIDQMEISNFGVKGCSSVEELYQIGDFITINIPATEDTIGSINYDLLSKTKKSAFLVNTARKDLIDEPGLMKTMEERPNYLYAADVAPNNRSEMEEKFPQRTLFTKQKMGAQTAEANTNSGVAAIKQTLNFFQSGDTTFQVN